jgi:Protein of unknown function (DUF3443)
VRLSERTSVVGDNGVPVVEVRVGNDPAVWVELDTGSVGLRVLASAVPAGPSSGLSATGRHDVERYRDGTTLVGTVVDAKVSVGGVTTGSPVPVESVRKVSCGVRHPRCPRLGGGVQHKVSGIMGVGLYGSSVGYPDNPLRALPKPYGQTWSIRLNQRSVADPFGILVLGADLPAQPMAQLRGRLNGNARPGQPAWSYPLLCWRIANAAKSCGETVLDTGAADGFATGTAGASKGLRSLPKGQSVALFAPGHVGPIWSFHAGDEEDLNQFFVSGRGNPIFNSGVALFASFSVDYDLQHGSIDLG